MASCMPTSCESRIITPVSASPLIDCSTLVAEVPSLLAAYVFGSRADSSDRRESDVDLAILTSTDLDNEERWRLQQGLARHLSRDVDLVDLRRAPTVLQIEVVARGERICCTDVTATELFEDFVFSSYALLNEERRQILEQVRAEGHVLAG